MEILFTFGIFGLCILGMSVGVIFSNRALRGSCGGPEIHDADGNSLSCGICPNKQADMCDSDDPLVALAQIANPNPKH